MLHNSPSHLGLYQHPIHTVVALPNICNNPLLQCKIFRKTTIFFIYIFIYQWILYVLENFGFYVQFNLIILSRDERKCNSTEPLLSKLHHFIYIRNALDPFFLLTSQLEMLRLDECERKNPKGDCHSVCI